MAGKEVPRDRWDTDTPSWAVPVLSLTGIVTPPLILRIWAQAPSDENGCLVWTGVLDPHGYGKIKSGGRGYSTHRIAWTWFNGREIPKGMTVDHLCRNRACCNPVHLDICTPGENALRSPMTLPSIHKAKTHCPQGHPYAGENLIVNNKGNRWCRACGIEHKRAYRARKAVAA